MDTHSETIQQPAEVAEQEKFDSFEAIKLYFKGLQKVEKELQKTITQDEPDQNVTIRNIYQQLYEYYSVYHPLVKAIHSPDQGYNASELVKEAKRRTQSYTDIPEIDLQNPNNPQDLLAKGVMVGIINHEIAANFQFLKGICIEYISAQETNNPLKYTSELVIRNAKRRTEALGEILQGVKDQIDNPFQVETVPMEMIKDKTFSIIHNMSWADKNNYVKKKVSMDGSVQWSKTWMELLFNNYASNVRKATALEKGHAVCNAVIDTITEDDKNFMRIRIQNSGQLYPLQIAQQKRFIEGVGGYKDTTQPSNRYGMSLLSYAMEQYGGKLIPENITVTEIDDENKEVEKKYAQLTILIPLTGE